jgi:hypothetical protein
MINKQFSFTKRVSSCCQDGFCRWPSNGFYTCDECGKKCEITELIYVTHKNVGKGTWRLLPEPILYTDLVFGEL